MSANTLGSFVRVLQGGVRSASFCGLQRSVASECRILQGRPAVFFVNSSNGTISRSLSTVPKSPQCLLKRHLRRPYLTPSASFMETDVSKIPKEDPVKGRLVYAGTLAQTVKFVKAFSVSTSMMGLAVQPFLYGNDDQLPKILIVAIGGMLSFFIFLTPLLLHTITKRYITKMYYNDDTGKFTATSYTFFVNEKDTQFGTSEVTYPEVPGLFSTIKVRGTPVFLDGAMFTDRKAYVRIMGYDKPMDLSYPSDEDKKN